MQWIWVSPLPKISACGAVRLVCTRLIKVNQQISNLARKPKGIQLWTVALFFLTLVVVAMWWCGRYFVNFHFSCHLVGGTHTVDAQVDATLVFALKKFTQMSMHFHFHMWRICSPTIGVIFTIIISRAAPASISNNPGTNFHLSPPGSAEANIWRESN